MLNAVVSKSSQYNETTDGEALCSLWQPPPWEACSKVVSELAPCGDLWKGISCEEGNGMRRVVNVTSDHYYNAGLRGSIPTLIGRLDALKILSLTRSRIYGSIPSEIGGCTSLTRLELDNNLLTGRIPTELANLKALVTLSLNFNSLSGKIPSLIGENLRNLSELDVSYNKLNDTVPCSFVRAPPRYAVQMNIYGNDKSFCLPTCFTFYMLAARETYEACNANQCAGGYYEDTTQWSASPPPREPSGKCQLCLVGYVNVFPFSVKKDDCSSLLSNVALSIIALFVSVLLICIYIYWGRYHYVAFIRFERIVLKLIAKYKLTIRSLLQLQQDLQQSVDLSGEVVQEKKKDRRLKKRVFWTLCALNFLFTPLIIFVVIIGRRLLDVLILWNGMKSTTTDFISTIQRAVADIGRVLKMQEFMRIIFLPVTLLLAALSKIQIDFGAVEVTCPGAQAPFYLLFQIAMLGVAVITIESDYQIFKATIFQTLLDKLKNVASSRAYRKFAISGDDRFHWSIYRYSRFLFYTACAEGFGFALDLPTLLKFGLTLVKLDALKYGVPLEIMKNPRFLPFVSIPFFIGISYYFAAGDYFARFYYEEQYDQYESADRGYKVYNFHHDDDQVRGYRYRPFPWTSLYWFLPNTRTCNDVPGLYRIDFLLYHVAFVISIFVMLPVFYEVGKIIAPGNRSRRDVILGGETDLVMMVRVEPYHLPSCEAVKKRLKSNYELFLWSTSIFSLDNWVAWLAERWLHLIHTAIPPSAQVTRAESFVRSTTRMSLGWSGLIDKIDRESLKLETGPAIQACCRGCLDDTIFASVYAIPPLEPFALHPPPPPVDEIPAKSSEEAGGSSEPEPMTHSTKPVQYSQEDYKIRFDLHPAKDAEEELDRWKQHCQHGSLPTYSEFLSIQYRRLLKILCNCTEDTYKNYLVPRLLTKLGAAAMVWYGFGNFTRAGREIWWQILRNYYVFTLSAVGIWIEEARHVYAVDECIRSTTVELERSEDGLAKEHAESEENDCIDRWLKYTQAWASIISPRAILFAVIPQLTPLMLYATICAATPIWILDKTVPQPPLFDLSPYYRKAERNRVQGDQQRWITRIDTVYLYATEGRLVQTIVNLYKVLFSLILWQAGSSGEVGRDQATALMVSSLFVLLPYSLVLALKPVVYLGKSLDIKDEDVNLFASSSLQDPQPQPQEQATIDGPGVSEVVSDDDRLDSIFRDSLYKVDAEIALCAVANPMQPTRRL